MATKKQKRLALAAKRERMEQEYRESGLKAQRADKARREAENRDRWKDVHEKRHFKFVDNCPICTDIKAEQRRGRGKAAIAKMAKVKSHNEAMNPEAIELKRTVEEIPDNSSVEDLECAG